MRFFSLLFFFSVGDVSAGADDLFLSPSYQDFQKNTKASLLNHYQKISDDNLRMFAGRWEARERDSERIVKALYDIPQGSHVLDLGSGIGFHSRELKKSGYNVTAVDPDLNSLAFGIVKGAYEGVTVLPTKLQDLNLSYN